jgi:hypothetical protein
MAELVVKRNATQLHTEKRTMQPHKPSRRTVLAGFAAVLFGWLMC